MKKEILISEKDLRHLFHWYQAENEFRIKLTAVLDRQKELKVELEKLKSHAHRLGRLRNYATNELSTLTKEEVLLARKLLREFNMTI